MAKPIANLRLFVAAYPPGHLVERWRTAIEAIELPEHRLVPAEQVHLTLQFIGDTPARLLDETLESVRRAASGLSPFELAAERLILLPQRGRARLVAVETNLHPTLLELQRRLALRLARNVRAKPGQKYRPHLTLCRFRMPARVTDIEAEIATESFTVEEVMVMRSTLDPKGVEHHAVESVALG